MNHRSFMGRPARGVALPLVLLLALALMAALAARRSATVETIAHNTRLRLVAEADAQAALRVCETQLQQTGEPVTGAASRLQGPDAPDARWRRLRHWTGGAKPLRCLAEAMADGRYLVTGRGLAGASAVDPATGALTGLTGGEAWWQAIVARDPCGHWLHHPYLLLEPPT
jgi:hypothetical protein